MRVVGYYKVCHPHSMDDTVIAFWNGKNWHLKNQSDLSYDDDDFNLIVEERIPIDTIDNISEFANYIHEVAGHKLTLDEFIDFLKKNNYICDAEIMTEYKNKILELKNAQLKESFN